MHYWRADDDRRNDRQLLDGGRGQRIDRTARERVGKVVVRAWRMIDAVPAASRRAALKAGQLRMHCLWSSSSQRLLLRSGSRFR